MGAASSLFPAATEADWRRAAEAALHGASLETLASKTADGIRIEPVYRPAEGPRALGRDGPWRVVARLDHPDPGEANAQALDDLANGADGLQVVFSGAPGAHGYGLRQIRSRNPPQGFRWRAFRRRGAFRARSRPRRPAAGARFRRADRTSGRKAGGLRSVLRARSVRGLGPRTVSAPTGQLRPRLISRARSHCEAWVLARRSWRPTRAVVHAAGGSPAQELAFALAAAVSLLRLLEAAGTPPAEARALIAFRLAADADEFATLAKFRALRIAWSRIEEACGLEPRAAHVHAESAWRMMTARDPYVNVMRGAMAAFSAGLGGADSVSVLPHTLAVGLPDSLARRLARNAQLILLRESHLGFVADPAAGAGAFEAMTKALCERAWALFQEIEEEGGLPSALASGAFQRQVAVSAAALARDIATVKSPITGVSAHADLAEPRVEVAPGAPERDAFTPAEGALAPFRLAEPFERLRDKSDAIVQRTGSRPRVYLAALGPEPAHRGRVAFMREWLEAGGFEAVYRRPERDRRRGGRTDEGERRAARLPVRRR